MKGFVNILKPLNMTSSDVVVKVRGILRRATQEKCKVGHLGTLDPLAVGVLPIAIGNATRLFDYMLQKQKTYIATFKFGTATDTLDRGGIITQTDNRIISKSDVEKAIPNLVGTVLQMPPQYSAKSINGKKAYDIARNGGVAELNPKQVTVSEITLLGCPGDIVNFPCDVFDEHSDNIINSVDYQLVQNEFAFRITCGSGTYIRAIARDMAQQMNTVGYMTSLCRTKTGDFLLDTSVALNEFEKEPLKYILPIENALMQYEKIDLNSVAGSKVLNGVKIKYDRENVSTISVSIDGILVGLGEIRDKYLTLKTRL